MESKEPTLATLTCSSWHKEYHTVLSTCMFQVHHQCH